MNAGSVHPSCTRDADKEAACDCGGEKDPPTGRRLRTARPRSQVLEHGEEIRERGGWIAKMLLAFFFCLDDDWIVPAPVELLIRLGMRNHVGYMWIRLVRGTGKQFPIFGARFGCEEISGGDKEVWKLASVVVEVVMQQGGFGTLFGFEFDENLCVFCFDFLFFTWFRL